MIMKQQQPDLKWYVLYTRPKFEKKICREIDYLKYENYLPLKVVTRRWSDRIKQIEEPLFASYVFAKTDDRHKVELLQIAGVIRFVAVEGKPSTIAASEIERVRLIESQGRDIQNEDYFAEGDQVMVTQGAFTGFKGILMRNVNRQSRFLIRLPLLKQAISIEMSASDLLRIN